MNSALFHAARPGDIGGGRQAERRKAFGMARQMGFGPQEVANAWKVLDDLAETDTDAYREIQEAAADHMRGDKKGVVGRSCFTPDPGFVVKTSLAQPYHVSTILHGRADGAGGAARKVSESAPTGTKVFINICSHEGVPPPKDQADRAVDVATEGRNASGLRMPMYCSSARETVDHKEERALAVDVVFHPWVIRSCRGERRFQDQVLNLAAEWIMKEQPGLVLDGRRGKLLKVNTYKGGGGPQGGTPLPFPVDDANTQNVAPEDRHSQDVVVSPRARGVNRALKTRNMNERKGGNGDGGDRGLLDESMKDPESLLAAWRKSSPAATSDNEERGRGDKGNSFTEVDRPETRNQYFSGSSIGEGEEEGGFGVAKLLGIGHRTGETRLERKDSRAHPPAELAGLPDSGGITRDGRGPLISEISPAKPGGARKGTDHKGDGNTQRGGGAPGGGQGRGTRESTGQRRRKPVVKKGFLKNVGEKSSPLYPPEGSENGGAGEAPMVKLMRQSKVVDTRDLSKQEIKAAMMAHAGGKENPVSSPRRRQHFSGGNKKSTAKDRKDLTARKGFLLEGGSSGALYGIEGSREGGGGTRPRQKVDPEFQRLVAMADPEWGDETPNKDDEDPLTEQLAQLAKIIGPQTPGAAPREVDAIRSSKASNAMVPPPPPPPGLPHLGGLSALEDDHHQVEQRGTQNIGGNYEKEESAPSCSADALGCFRGENQEGAARVASAKVPPTPTVTAPSVTQQCHHGVGSTRPRPVAEGELATVEKRTTEAGAEAGNVLGAAVPAAPDDVVENPKKSRIPGGAVQAKQRRNATVKGQGRDAEVVKVTEATLTTETEHAGQASAAPEHLGKLPTRSRTATTSKSGVAKNSQSFPELHKRRRPKPTAGRPHAPPPPRAEEDGNTPHDGSGTSGTDFPVREKVGEAEAEVEAGEDMSTTTRREREPAYTIEEHVLPPAGESGSLGGRGDEGPGRRDPKRGVVVVVHLPELTSADPIRGEIGSGTGTGHGGRGSGGRGKGRKFSMRDVELDVLSGAVDMRVPGVYRLHLQLPFSVDKDDVTAKISRAKATLTISAREA